MNPPAAPRRFQTRAGVQRRSKEEREAYEQSEREKRHQRIAEAARSGHSTVARGAHPPRGRGQAVIHNAERIRNENVGGVFGAALPGAPKARGARATSSLSRASGSKEDHVDGDKVTTEPAEGKSTEHGAIPNQIGTRKPPERAKSTAASRDDVTEVSSDSGDEEGEKKDIEEIATIIIDGEEEAEGPTSSIGNHRERQKPAWSRTTNYGPALRPVRAPREKAGVGSGDSSEKGIGSKQPGSTAHRRKVNESASGAVTAGGLDQHASTASEEDALELEGNVPPAYANSHQDHSRLEDEPSLNHEAKLKRPRKRSSYGRDSKIAFETTEERAERERNAKDVLSLREELLPMPPSKPAAEDVGMRDLATIDRSDSAARHTNLYLFQFPPLTPMLVDPNEPVEVKPEPGNENAESTALHPAAGRNVSAIKIEDVATVKERPTIKKEDDIPEVKPLNPTQTAEVMTADSSRLPAGLAGKLSVHRSGKVTLEWGRTNMEVKWGSEVDCLQEVVLVGGEGEDTAWSFSQMKSKMVVIPDWQKIYE